MAPDGADGRDRGRGGVRIPKLVTPIAQFRPDEVHSVLQTNVRKFAKRPDYVRLNSVLGEGLLTSEGPP